MKTRKASDLTILCSPAGREDEIAALVLAAFRRRFGTGPEEVAILSALRRDGDVLLELMAMEDGVILGHAMFSGMRATPDDRRIAALGPVAVRIDRQREGIGGALIRAGLERCRRTGTQAVAVLGDPIYYALFGFSAELAAPIACSFAGPHFQALELQIGALAGTTALHYAPAFQSSSV